MKTNDFNMDKMIAEYVRPNFKELLFSNTKKIVRGSEMIDGEKRLIESERKMFPVRLRERYKTLQGRGNQDCKSQTALGEAFYRLYQPNKDIPGSPDQIIRSWMQGKGKGVPSDKKIKCLAEILDCYPDYLLGYRPDANEREFPEMYKSMEEFESAKEERTNTFHNAVMVKELLNKFGYFCNLNLNDNSIDIDATCSASALTPQALDYKIESDNHEAFLKEIRNYLDFLILKYSFPIKYWEDDPPILAQSIDRKKEKNKSQ